MCPTNLFSNIISKQIEIMDLLQTSSLGVSKRIAGGSFKNSRPKLLILKKTDRVLVVLKGSIGPGDVPTARVLRNGE